MNQFVVALCGIPASGKTTLARQIIHHHPPPSKVELVSTDHWRDEAFYADFSPKKENEVRRKALERARDLADSGVSVVHDDTNYYASMRHEIREIALNHTCVYGTVFVTTPLEVALKWNKERRMIIPEHVIRRIDDRLDIPGKKYAWDEPLATIDLSRKSATQGAIEILEALQKAQAEEQPQDVSKTENNQLDVATRRVVSDFLEDNPDLGPDERVHVTRREILQQALLEEWTVGATKARLRTELEKLSSREMEE
jgi:O-phosphoseryl-tRNA(Sec) kinase